MSDIPVDPAVSASTPTTSATHPKKKQNHRKHKHEKYDKRNLPTPPPDPNEAKNPMDSRERDILEYLESIIPNYTRSTSLFAPVAATEEAFDHLDKLYKLMEQMLELREQNARLHRRIRDLERFNKLEKMQRELEAAVLQGGSCPDVDRDSIFAETLLESILTESGKKDQKQSKILTPTILRPSILRRNRSGSGTDKQVTLDANVIMQLEDGCEKVDKSSKVSKWTKVKAAFRWEKASTSVADNKSQDSGIHVPANIEIIKYLRVPSTSDETGHSPADSGAAGISTPGSLSTTSSNEDLRRSEIRTPYEDLRSSDDDRSQTNYIPQSKEEKSSSKPSKLSKKPWAKMKDIIHTRNSFKKKHRLSAASDEIHIDVEFCTDNEDNVFEDETKIKTAGSSSCSSRKNSLPQEIIERYHKAVEEDNDADSSRWNRVKKAFLTKETHSSTSKGTTNAEDEIQRNYKKLQKKLSLEFQEKMSEWERLKQNSPGTSSPSPSGFSEENRDPNFMKKIEEWQKIKSQPAPRSPLPSEFDLPPDFKKKLQEWEKIKKGSCGPAKKKLADVPKWKSLSGHRYEPVASTSTFEYPALSDEFKKKLEEWKQIKSGGGILNLKDKTPSPKLTRKNSSPRHSKKQKQSEKDSHWFEKELGKIEKEKQRLEKERQKFLEREERLSKLPKSVIEDRKKEVLVHTSSGFYRFEGISRKFAQKLYEWEKAQGIGPEESTFALLASSYQPETKPIIVRQNATPPLLRSKSVDSIAISALNLTCPLLSQQPSSLSLNDMDDLERKCLADSQCSSMQYLLASQEEEDEEDYEEEDEPQALLVEIEDYEEETAAPLHTVSEKQQLPVYQRQEFKTLCAGETLATPKVRRSESTRAQTNYNLIEDIINILRQLAENELEIRSISQLEIKQAPENISKLEEIYDYQKHFSSELSEKILKLQEANTLVASAITKDETNSSQTHLIEMLEAVQDLSNEVSQMAEKMDQNINSRTLENFNTTSTLYLQILENIRDVRSRILELRRHLSYVCAASDTTVPSRKRSGNKQKTLVYKTVSNESKSSRCDTSDASSRKGSQREDKHYIKGENSNITSNQSAIRKRIKYRQKSMLNKTLIDTDDEEDDGDNEDEEVQQKNTRHHKKLARAKTLAELEGESEADKTKEESGLSAKLLVSTGSNFAAINVQEETPKRLSESPLTVFVKTTRKLFTPIGEAGLSLGKSSPTPVESPEIVIDSKEVSTPKSEEFRSQLPPLPPSPVPQRKIFKEISPSIRVMMAKYNQKLSEQDTKSNKSGNSSGSNSPIWRSPTSERRVRAQTEKYQEELIKLSPLLGSRKEVQKSASVGYIHSGNKQVTLPVRRDSVHEHLMACAGPSSSAKEKESLKQEQPREEVSLSKKSMEAARKLLTLDINRTNSDATSKHSPEVRQKKLQQAKEEFLKSSPMSAPPDLDTEKLNFPARNRLSQISFDSESSYDNTLPGALMKSVSVGMINVDPETYRQIDPELHSRGYVSLPRNSKQPKSSKFGFAQIASKFRKVKMRKGKDKEKSLNTVSALCRQSLVVDITKSEDERRTNDVSDTTRRTSAGDRVETPSSTSSSRSNSWIRMSLFKK